MNNEIIAEIRNKLQAPLLVLQMLVEGKNIPEQFVELAKSELVLVEELFQKIHFVNKSNKN